MRKCGQDKQHKWTSIFSFQIQYTENQTSIESLTENSHNYDLRFATPISLKNVLIPAKTIW